MHFHWQNLNDKPGGLQGSGVRHGRAWWHFGERGVLGLEWGFFKPSFGVSFGAEASDGVGLKASLCVSLFTLYVHAHGGPFAWAAKKILPWHDVEHDGKTYRIHADREVSFRVFDWALQWTIWKDWRDGWSSRDPRWRDGSFDVVDFVFGRTSYEERVLLEEPVVVPMPERGYRGTVKIQERTWRRPRWPLVWHRRVGADVDMGKDPIPFPGKGENSWDCGEDALYGSSNHATTASEAIAKVVESVLRSRHRHGGRDWMPMVVEYPRGTTP